MRCPLLLTQKMWWLGLRVYRKTGTQMAGQAMSEILAYKTRRVLGNGCDESFNGKVFYTPQRDSDINRAVAEPFPYCPLTQLSVPPICT